MVGFIFIPLWLKCLFVSFNFKDALNAVEFKHANLINESKLYLSMLHRVFLIKKKQIVMPPHRELGSCMVV